MTTKRFTVEEMQNWNKRYKLSSDTLKVIDTYDGGEYCTIHGNEAYNLCIDINRLYDENEQLKASNEGLLKDLNYRFKLIKSVEKENQQLKRQIGNLEHIRDFCVEDCERLEKENKQLKSEIKEVRGAYEQLWMRLYDY